MNSCVDQAELSFGTYYSRIFLVTLAFLIFIASSWESMISSFGTLEQSIEYKFGDLLRKLMELILLYSELELLGFLSIIK